MTPNDLLDLLLNTQQSLTFLEMRINQKITDLQVLFSTELTTIKQRLEAARLIVLEELNQENQEGGNQ